MCACVCVCQRQIKMISFIFLRNEYLRRHRRKRFKINRKRNNVRQKQMRTRTCVLLAALAHTHTHTLPDISRPKRMRSEFHLIVTFFAHKPGNKWLLACSAYHARRLQFRKANGMDVFHFVIFVHDNSSHLFIFGFRHFHRFARIRFPCFPMAVCDVQRDSTNEICMRVKWRIFSHFARRNMLRHADCELLLNHLIEIKSESKRNGYCCFNQKQFRLFHFLELCVCNAISAIWQMPMNNYIFFSSSYLLLFAVSSVFVFIHSNLFAKASVISGQWKRRNRHPIIM